jgi:hypothetical protein
MPPPLIRKETARLDQRSGLLPSNLPWPADARGPAHPGGNTACPAPVSFALT